MSGNWFSIGSANDLSPVQCQAITWTNAGLLPIGLLGTNSRQIWIGILSFSFKKMHLKMLSARMMAILSRGRWVNEIYTKQYTLVSAELNKNLHLILKYKVFTQWDKYMLLPDADMGNYFCHTMPYEYHQSSMSQPWWLYAVGGDTDKFYFPKSGEHSWWIRCNQCM